MSSLGYFDLKMSFRPETVQNMAKNLSRKLVNIKSNLTQDCQKILINSWRFDFNSWTISSVNERDENI